MLLRTASVPSAPSLAVIMFCLVWPATKLIDATPFHAVSPGKTVIEPDRPGTSTDMLMVTAAAPAGIAPRPVTANRVIWALANPEPVRVSSTRVASTGWKVPAAAAGAAAELLVVVSSSTAQLAATVTRQDRMATSRRMRFPRQCSDETSRIRRTPNSWHAQTEV